MSVTASASKPSVVSNSPQTLEPTSHNGMDSTAGDIEPPAPYPTSFSQIVELITSGEPIPGIKEVPDTVLEGQASHATTAKRKKPWERDDLDAGDESVGANDSSVNTA